MPVLRDWLCNKLLSQPKKCRICGILRAFTLGAFRAILVRESVYRKGALSPLSWRRVFAK